MARPHRRLLPPLQMRPPEEQELEARHPARHPGPPPLMELPWHVHPRVEGSRCRLALDRPTAVLLPPRLRQRLLLLQRCRVARMPHHCIRCLCPRHKIKLLLPDRICKAAVRPRHRLRSLLLQRL